MREISNKSFYKEILIHLFSWLCLFLFPLTTTLTELDHVPKEVLIRLLSAPILFYTNYFLLVPKLLLRKQILLYIFSSIVFLCIFNYFMLTFVPNSPFHRFESILKENDTVPFAGGIKYIVPVVFTLSIFLLGGIIALVIDFYKRDRLSKALETNQKEMELQFLRAQLNPHFLFNSLNSIYSLVQSKSKLAPEAVITLSELMRYMLYEVSDDEMSLEKEINYIKNYIALQRLRLKNSEEVHLNIKGNTKNLKIQPLLLITFIENAFKYGTDYKGNTNIKIAIAVTEDSTLNFKIENIIGLYKKDETNSGVGLSNIQKQLKHLYKNKHTININTENGYYKVDLSMKLD